MSGNTFHKLTFKSFIVYRSEKRTKQVLKSWSSKFIYNTSNESWQTCPKTKKNISNAGTSFVIYTFSLLSFYVTILNEETIIIA